MRRVGGVCYRDRRQLPDLLPRVDQHAPRAAVRRRARARVDAHLCRRALGGALEAARARVTAVRLRSVEACCDGERRRGTEP